MPDCERVGPEFIETAPVVLSAEVTVTASPAQVWRVLNETDRWPEWFDGMTTARVTSAAWDGIGSTRYVKVGPLGVDEQVIVWEPERHWGFCATKLSASGYVAKKLLETVEISPEGSGSRLIYTGALEPVPWIRPIVGLIKKRMSSSWAASLANIDNQISGESPSA